jgi:hypothetical protein
MHGGTTPGGIASPHYKNGRYSKYLKGLPQVKQRLADAVADPNLVALDQELGLLTVRIGELLTNLGDAKPPPWDKAVAMVRSVSTMEEGQERETAIDRLLAFVVAGADAAATQEHAWGQIRELVQERTRTAAAEWKRLSDLDAVVTVEQCLLFVRAFLDAARETVTDPKMLQAFQRKVVGLLPPEQPVVVQSE